MEYVKIPILIILGILVFLFAIKIGDTFYSYGFTVKGAENDVIIEAFVIVVTIYLFYTVLHLK